MKLYVYTTFNPNVGIGHFHRCVSFSKFGLKKKYFSKVYLFLDNNSIKTTKSYKNITILYNIDNLLTKSSKDKKNVLLIDNYNLKESDYKFFYDRFNTIILDDLLDRKIFCNFYINYKNINWKSNSNLKKINMYLNYESKKLLGQKFYILRENSFKTYNFKKTFNIMFYSGGKGVEKEFIKTIHFFQKNKHYINNYKLFVIKSFFLKKQVITDRNVFYIYGGEKFDQFLSNTNLFLGTSSNLIYENNHLSIPSVFYSAGKNQKNNIEDLESLGHYFMISKKDVFSKNLPNLVLLIKKKYSMIYKLFQNVPKVDNNGLKNIFNQVFGEKSSQNLLPNKKKVIRYDNVYKKCNIEDINAIHKSRNLISNRIKFISNKYIPKLDHYIFFLNSKRKYFKFYQSDIPVAFFWHDFIKIKDVKYIITGWHCNKNIEPISIYKFNKWHIELLEKYPYDWICVIKKTNKFVYNMNKYFGFKKIRKNSLEFLNTRNFFKVSINDYYFMKLDK